MRTYRLTFNDAPSITIEASSARRAAIKYARTRGSLGMINSIRNTRVRNLWEIMGTSGMIIYVQITGE